MYEYEATLLKVIDGDTIDVRISLGFDTYHDIRLRLNGINAPELHSKSGTERAKAANAKAYIVKNLSEKDRALVVNTFKDRTEKYGRYLADVRNWNSPVTINQQLLNEKLATPYDGTGSVG